MLAALKASGVRPELVHAFERTGLLVSEDNQHLFTKAKLTDWHEALAEYRARQASGR